MSHGTVAKNFILSRSLVERIAEFAESSKKPKSMVVEMAIMDYLSSRDTSVLPRSSDTKTKQYKLSPIAAKKLESYAEINGMVQYRIVEAACNSFITRSLACEPYSYATNQN